MTGYQRITRRSFSSLPVATAAWAYIVDPLSKRTNEASMPWFHTRSTICNSAVVFLSRASLRRFQPQVRLSMAFNQVLGRFAELIKAISTGKKWSRYDTPIASSGYLILNGRAYDQNGNWAVQFKSLSMHVKTVWIMDGLVRMQVMEPVLAFVLPWITCLRFL